MHRHIAHPFYHHTIRSLSCAVRRNGQFMVDKVPHLLVDGQLKPWSALCQNLHIDESSRIYTLDNEQKIYWMYVKSRTDKMG
jgi:hypothetical protein